MHTLPQELRQLLTVDYNYRLKQVLRQTQELVFVFFFFMPRAPWDYLNFKPVLLQRFFLSFFVVAYAKQQGKLRLTHRFFLSSLTDQISSLHLHRRLSDCDQSHRLCGITLLNAVLLNSSKKKQSCTTLNKWPSLIWQRKLHFVYTRRKGQCVISCIRHPPAHPEDACSHQRRGRRYVLSCHLASPALGAGAGTRFHWWEVPQVGAWGSVPAFCPRVGGLEPQAEGSHPAKPGGEETLWMGDCYWNMWCTG